MKRRYLLIAGCILGAASVVLNIQLFLQRREAPSSGTSSSTPAMPQAKFDFSDTAFADGSWKLTEPESAVKLDKPFDWEDVNPAKLKTDPPSSPPK